MYVIKNALRNIKRGRVRTILTLVLILAITASTCVALSIRNSANDAKEQAYEGMSVTATIGIDRESMMEQQTEDMAGMMDMMRQYMPEEELLVYAEADSVSDFYYSKAISLNGVEIEPYETSDSAMDQFEQMSGMSGGKSGMMGGGMPTGSMGGDFTVLSYNSHSAMSDFVNGILAVTEGEMFAEDSTENEAVISAEMAYQNNLEVGDTISLENPTNEADIITMTVTGIFECATTDIYADTVYISDPSMDGIMASSETVAIDYTDERTGELSSSALTSELSGTYVFDSVEDYESFENEAVELGLDTSIYAINSVDASEFESSLVPLDNLTSFTMIFFIVILVIGAIILIVFQLFSVRERKYEMGVLAAIGMKKSKVASQFLVEVLVITFIAVILGTALGAVVSQPVADTLLESQIESAESESANIAGNFGGNFAGGPGERGNSSMFEGMQGGDVSYIDSLGVNLDIIVLLQVVGVGILLTLVASSVGILSVLRYEPLKILSDRS